MDRMIGNEALSAPADGVFRLRLPQSVDTLDDFYHLEALHSVDGDGGATGEHVDDVLEDKLVVGSGAGIAAVVVGGGSGGQRRQRIVL